MHVPSLSIFRKESSCGGTKCRMPSTWQKSSPKSCGSFPLSDLSLLAAAHLQGAWTHQESIICLPFCRNNALIMMLQMQLQASSTRDTMSVFFVMLGVWIVWLIFIVTSSTVGIWKVEFHQQQFTDTESSRHFAINNNKKKKRLRGLHDVCNPSHIHLSPTNNVNLESFQVNMTVSFTLPDDLHCHPSVVTPIVWYGRRRRQNDDESLRSSFNRPQYTIPSESFQFNYSNGDQNYTSSWIHHAVLSDLEGGGKLYWYSIQVIPNAVVLAKKASGPVVPETVPLIYNFTTPPGPLAPVRIAMVADWGRTDPSLSTMKRLKARQRTTGASVAPLSAILVAGDISYANSHLPQWENWLSMVETLVSSTPLLVAAGNHEIECDRETLQVFPAYESYFRNPNRIAAPYREPVNAGLECFNPSEFMTTYYYGNSFYSYRHGLLQIVVLNCYTNTTKGSVQYKWLKEELETRIDRNMTPWLLVTFHCPLHTTFRGHNNERNANLILEHMEPLFVQHGVNLVLSGHNHAYVRSVPMNGSKPSAAVGPIYLTIGTGGISHSDDPLQPDPPEEWVAHRDNTEFGFGELLVVNATHAYFQRILNRGTKANPKAQDAVWIENDLYDAGHVVAPTAISHSTATTSYE